MDHVPVIRAQIARDIAALKREFRSAEPEYVTVGYLIATHRGQDIVKEGELIEGLPVRIDRVQMRTLSVRADQVGFSEDYDTEDNDGRLVVRTRYWTEDVVHSTTW